MSNLHVSIVSVPVADQKRARDFYREKLGFGVVIENPHAMGPEHDWVVMVGPGGGCHISLVTWFDSMAPGSLRGLVIETSDIDGEHNRMRKAGVDIDDIKGEFWDRYATLRDSEGNGLVLMAPAQR